MFKRVSIVGVGLVGGSIGLALHKHLPKVTVVGVDKNRQKLTIAKTTGAIDDLADSLQDGIANSDLVIVCTPVGQVARTVIHASQSVSRPLLFTDVGSTKQMICEEIASTGIRNFLGGHPIAGSEKSGPEHSSATLFEKKTVVLTPSQKNDPSDIELLTQFWESLGATVVSMSPLEHDAVFAMTSHLPHAVSAMLTASLVPGISPKFIGAGFQSMARLAASDAELWTDIFMSNRSALIESLGRFTDYCLTLKAELEKNDAAAVLSLLKQGNRNTVK